MLDIEDAFASTEEVRIHGDEEIAQELIDFIDALVRDTFPVSAADVNEEEERLTSLIEFGVRCFIAGQVFQAGNHVVTLSLTEDTASTLLESLIKRTEDQ